MIKIAVTKLTNTPKHKRVLKEHFKPNWQEPDKLIPFDRDSLQSGGYIGIPKKSSPPLLVIDFDLPNMDNETKQEASLLINTLLETNLYVKTTKGYHFYFLLPKDPHSLYHRNSLNIREGVDIPTGVFLPLSDTTKTLHNENKPIVEPPEELTNFLFKYKDKDKDKDKDKYKPNHTLEQYYINYGYIKPFKDELETSQRDSNSALNDPYLLRLFEEILYSYNAGINPNSSFARHLKEQDISFNIIKSGEKNQQLNRLAFLLLKDPSVDEQTFKLLTTLYNIYLDREERDKEEHIAIINSLLNTQEFNFDLNTQKTLTKSITVTHSITSIKFHILATPESKFYLLPYLPHANPEQTIFTKQAMQQLLIRDFNIPKQKAKSLLERAPIVSLINDPLTGYGLIPKHLSLYSATNKFNIAIQTDSMRAFKDKSSYSNRIVKGYLTLLDNLTNSDKFLQDYILSYFKTRYQSPKLRPIIFCFWGIGGSGKDTLINLLSSPFGEPTTLTENIALDKHSSWQIEPNVHISEIADWTKQAQSQFKAQLKTITGSQGTVTIRPMHKTTVNIKSYVQIFISMNTPTAIHSTPNELRRYVICRSNTTLLKALDNYNSSLDIDEQVTIEELTDPKNYHHFHAWLSTYTPKYEHNFYSAEATQKSRVFRDYLDLTTTNKDKIVHALNAEPTTNFIRLSTFEYILKEVHDISLETLLEENASQIKVQPYEILIARPLANKLLYKENAIIYLSEDKLPFNGNYAPYITIQGSIQKKVKPLDKYEDINIE